MKLQRCHVLKMFISNFKIKRNWMNEIAASPFFKKKNFKLIISNRWNSSKWKLDSDFNADCGPINRWKWMNEWIDEWKSAIWKPIAMDRWMILQADFSCHCWRPFCFSSSSSSSCRGCWLVLLLLLLLLLLLFRFLVWNQEQLIPLAIGLDPSGWLVAELVRNW